MYIKYYVKHTILLLLLFLVHISHTKILIIRLNTYTTKMFKYKTHAILIPAAKEMAMLRIA